MKVCFESLSIDLERNHVCVQDAGALGKKMKDGVKLLGRGAEKFSLPLQIEVIFFDSPSFSTTSFGSSMCEVM